MYPDGKSGLIKKSSPYGVLLSVDGTYRVGIQNKIEITSNGDKSKEFKIFYKNINAFAFYQKEINSPLGTNNGPIKRH